MKIEGDKYIVFRMGDDWEKITQSYAEQWKSTVGNQKPLWTYEESDGYQSRLKMMREFRDLKAPIYYMSKGALEMCRRIMIAKFDVKQLKGKVEEGGTIIISQDKFYRYLEYQGNLLVVYMTVMGLGGENYYEWVTFRVNLDDGYYSDGGNEEVFLEFIQIMCFMKLGTPEYVILKDGQKTGTRKTEKVINKSGEEVTLVRTDWNKVYIKKGFHVRGHWRFQHYGPNGEDMKLIFIEEFVKKGYTRTIKK